MSAHTGSPEATIERVAKGASYVVMLTRSRLLEALDAFDEGDFSRANNHLGEAQVKLGALVHAQQSLGTFTDDMRVVRAGQLWVGCEFYGGGEITAIEEQDHGDHKCVLLSFDDGHQERYREEQECLVVVADE